MSKVEACLESPATGTLSWLKQDPGFIDWCNATSPTLMYVTGYPGCGKTTMASHVVRSLLQKPSPLVVVCWFFCSSRSDQEQNIPCLFRTIIHQVVLRRRSLLKLVRKASDIRPTLFDSADNLWDLFMSLVERDKDLSFSIIVDAIDECDHLSQKIFVESILTLLRSRLNTQVKFFVTSRPNCYAAHAVRGTAVSHIPLRLEHAHDLIVQDVRLVIHERVQALVLRGSCNVELGRELEKILMDKAEGTFLWVSLMLDMFEQRRFLRRADVAKVKLLPQQLEALYSDFLTMIPSDDRALAAILLRTIACSTRPLRSEELSILMDGDGISADNTQELELENASIQALLHPLTKLQDDKVLLVHHSLKEYLIDDQHDLMNLDLSCFHIDQELEAYRLAATCIEYLTMDEFSHGLLTESWTESWIESPSPVSPELSLRNDHEEDDHPFNFQFDLEDTELFKDREVQEAQTWAEAASRYKLLDYAANSWTEHLVHCSSFDVVKVLDLVLKLCYPSAPYLSNWSQYLRSTNHLFNDLPVKLDPVIVASYFGLHMVLARITEQNDESLQYGQALYWAARKGSLRCLQYLLELLHERQHFTAGSCYVLQQSPLAAAAQQGHLDCVRAVLKSKLFEINYTDKHGRTALSYAAGGGYSSIIAALLSEPHVNGDIPDHSGCTAMHWAASANSVDGVSLLLKHSTVQPNHTDHKGRTALSWAAIEGHTGVGKVLLKDLRVSANISDVHRCPPLLHAVQHGHLSFVKALVHSKRVDLSATDHSGRNCISWAAERRDEGCAMLHYLLKHDKGGADKPDNDGWTPLSWAMNPPGYPENVICLLSTGLVDINRQDSNGRTALSFAVTYGHIGIMQILMRRREVRINLPDVDGRTPLSYAAANGSLEMVRLLVADGETDLKAVDEKGKSPLAYANQNGHSEVVELLQDVEETSLTII